MKLILFLQFLVYVHVSAIWQQQDPDQFRDASQIIRSRGFLVEEHRAVTPDGYILTLHRIVNPHAGRYRRKKPLLLMHGILASATDWIMSRPGMLTPDGDYLEDRYLMPTAFRNLNQRTVPIGGSTAFVLSQFGYDVWLGNARGTVYSRNHIRLNSKTDMRYWMFAIDHVALLDIPTMINHVLRATRKESLGYVCHSMGCTAVFAMLSAKPQYNRRITDLIALAPVVFDTNTILVPQVAFLAPVLRAIPMGILGPFRPQLTLQGVLCRDKALRYACTTLLGIFTGLNLRGVAHDRLAAFASHFPTGVSTWVLSQYMQWGATGRFARFDYGRQRNLVVYGQTCPPEYPLHRIKIRRISIFYSTNDKVSEYRNVLMIKRFLSVPLFSENLIRDPNWGHFDFFAHSNVGFYMNAKILDLLAAGQTMRHKTIGYS